jgi:hypothetical protein
LSALLLHSLSSSLVHYHSCPFLPYSLSVVTSFFIISTASFSILYPPC